MNYYDADGNDTEIVGQHQFIWFPNVPWNVPAPKFPHYQYGWQTQSKTGATLNISDYYHEVTTITYKYYSTTGQYLGQTQTTGLYGQHYTVNVPDWIGRYEVQGSTQESGTYPHKDTTIKVTYKYVPLIYFYTSNPYVHGYFANGNEYVPIYVAPQQNYNRGNELSIPGVSNSNTLNRNPKDKHGTLPNTGDNNENSKEITKDFLQSLIGGATSKFGTWALIIERTIDKEISDSVLGLAFDAFTNFLENKNPDIALLITLFHTAIAAVVNIAADMLAPESFGVSLLAALVIIPILDTIADYFIRKYLEK
jgi:hypothetical protein